MTRCHDEEHIFAFEETYSKGKKAAAGCVIYEQRKFYIPAGKQKIKTEVVYYYECSYSPVIVCEQCFKLGRVKNTHYRRRENVVACMACWNKLKPKIKLIRNLERLGLDIRRSVRSIATDLAAKRKHEKQTLQLTGVQNEITSGRS